MSEATLAQRLRAVADLLDRHPSLPVPVVFAYTSGSTDVTWQLMNGDTSERQRELMQSIRRTIGGQWDKVGLGDSFILRQLHPLFRLEVMAERDQVCERVVIGTETVTVPAVEARAERVEAEADEAVRLGNAGAEG